MKYGTKNTAEYLKLVKFNRGLLLAPTFAMKFQKSLTQKKKKIPFQHRLTVSLWVWARILVQLSSMLITWPIGQRQAKSFQFGQFLPTFKVRPDSHTATWEKNSSWNTGRTTMGCLGRGRHRVVTLEQLRRWQFSLLSHSFPGSIQMNSAITKLSLENKI